MARLNPGDATTDFFLLLSDIKGFDSDAPGGDGVGFAVFGEIVAGSDIAEAIFNAPVSPTAGQGVMVGQMLEPQVTIKNRAARARTCRRAKRLCRQSAVKLRRDHIIYFAFIRAVAIPRA